MATIGAEPGVTQVSQICLRAERLAERLACLDIPHPQGAVTTDRDEAKAVGTECHACHVLIPNHWLTKGLAGLDVPSPQRRTNDRYHASAVRVEHHKVH